MMKKFLLSLLLSATLAFPTFADQVSDVTLAPGISGTDLRTEQNDINDAFNTTHKGSSAPGSIDTGTIWIDDSGGATAWLVKMYDGSDHITVGTFNTTANTFTPSGQLATFANAVSAKTATHAMGSSDYGKLVTNDATSGAITANIDAVAGLGSSWYVIVQKIDGSANAVTIDPNASELINGASTLVLTDAYEGAIVIKDGSGFKAVRFGSTGVIKVSGDDTTPGFLEGKLLGGDGIAMSTANGGANETRTVAVDLATDPGLEINSAKLRVKAGTGIVRNSSGVNVDVGTTANKIVQLNGSAQLPAVDGSLLTNLPTPAADKQTFNSSGTWTKPAGYSTTRPVLLECWGAGGGGAISGGGNGGNGGASSVGSLIIAYGGSGGGGTDAGAAGGIAATVGVGVAFNDAAPQGMGGGNGILPSSIPSGGYYIGGGGGKASAGAKSVYGGGGGGGGNFGGGTSIFGGSGGSGGISSGSPGTAPGGGGGGTGPGGGGGSYKHRWVQMSSLGSSETVTIGTGGAGGSGAGGGGAGAAGRCVVTVY